LINDNDIYGGKGKVRLDLITFQSLRDNTLVETYYLRLSVPNIV